MRDVRIDSRFRPVTDAVPCVLCLGNFDGVHKAHAMLVHAAVELAENHKTICGLFDKLDKLGVPFWLQNAVIM